MYSNTKNRPRPKSKHKPEFNGRPSSSSSSLKWIMEPPQNFFPSKDEFLRLITVLAIASSVALACTFVSNFLNRQQQKSFCDSDVEFQDSLFDVCEPCPSNGECYHGNLECFRGYKKQGKLCVEDSDITETAKKLSEWVENRLCESYAQFLCDGIGTIWARRDDVWNELDGHSMVENLGLDNSSYTITKERAMDTIGRLLETRINSYGIKELKCPDLLVEYYKPFTCRVRQWISENALIIVSVCSLILGCTFLLWKIRRRQYLSTRVEELYWQVCDILEENALASKAINGECDPWVVASRLRDHLLLPKERKDPLLWKKVEKMVQEDSRVDRYPKLVKGESKVVWEWQVEGTLSSSRSRKKGEASKFKSTAVMEAASVQQHYTGKAEPTTLFF